MGVAAGEWQQSRLKRHEALEVSIDKDPSMPPKDRLESLQLHVPELFAHVSLKGFKRLISQVGIRVAWNIRVSVWPQPV